MPGDAMVKDARPLEDVMVGDTVEREAMAGEGVVRYAAARGRVAGDAVAGSAVVRNTAF